MNSSSSSSNSLDSQRQLEESLKLKRRLISAIEDNLNPHPHHHHHQISRSTFHSTDNIGAGAGAGASAGPISLLSPASLMPNKNILALARGEAGFFVDDRDPLGVSASTVPPPPPPPAVTVVLEGRSICQRISLHKHASYQSLAKALRQMFVVDNISEAADDNLSLSNAIPGHLIAYEDMENDLLLVGDLSWKDFVRVAKRIRILLRPRQIQDREGQKEEGLIN